MNILSAEKYYFITGGASRVFFETNRLLAARGHQVIPFTGGYAQNFPSPYARYFVPRVTMFSGDGEETISPRNALKAFADALYARDVVKSIERLLLDHPIDIAHLHTILFQLSPSLIRTLKRHGVPVVQTLHDFSLGCASRYLYSRGAVCERCKGGRYHQILLQNCCNGNPWLGWLSFSAKCIHHALRLYPGEVDMFIAPSRFLRNKMIAWGLAPQRIVHIDHFLPASPEPDSPPDEEDYFLFAGYLVRQKGIYTLLKAMSQIPRGRLLIAGRGPERDGIQKFIQEQGLGNVELVGFRTERDLADLIRKSRFVIFPSEWYETFGMGILEAFILGKPVIASAIGAYPEIVQHGKTGLLFEPGRVEALARSIRFLNEHEGERREMGRRARELALENYHEDLHYQKLLAVYEKAIRA